MDRNEPTAIMADWLVADSTYALHLRRVYEGGGIMAMRTDAEPYLQVNADSNATARLLRWGNAHGPSRISRYRMLMWVFDHVDWVYLAAQLPRRGGVRPVTRQDEGQLSLGESGNLALSALSIDWYRRKRTGDSVR